MVLYIGISGTLLSGKGTVKEIIENKYKTFSVHTSDIVREEAVHRGLKEWTRSQLVDIANDLRSKKGPGVFAEMAIEKIRKQTDEYEVMIIDGIRNPGEINALRTMFGGYFVLIFIDAPRKTRYKRSAKRKREGEGTRTYEQFKEEDEREMKSEKKWEINFEECMKKANKKIINDGTRDELGVKVIEFVDSKINETKEKSEREKKYGYAKSFVRKDSEKESRVTKTQAE